MRDSVTDAAVSATTIIHAPAAHVYGIIADYRAGGFGAGLLGLVERVVTAAMLRRIYRKELARLDQYAATVDSGHSIRRP